MLVFACTSCQAILYGHHFFHLVLFFVGVEIGELPNEQHQISGTFHILDSKTIYIEDFNYDGGGPG